MINFLIFYLTESIGNGWNFDRKKFLDGTKLKVVVDVPAHSPVILDKDYDESVLGTTVRLHDAHVINALKMTLNVTLVINFDENYWGITTEIRGFFKRLQYGSSDLAVCMRNLHQTYNLTVTYPIMHSEISIMTQKLGYYTPFEKIMNYYGLVTFVSMLIILTITFGFIVIVGKKKLSFAIFELLRLLVNTSVHSKMHTFPRRMFFLMIFLYFLIIHATFQGRLSTFLTKEEERKNVESLNDLKNPRYKTVYITSTGPKYIHDSELEKKLVIPQHIFECLKVVENDSLACIADVIILTNIAIKHDLHMARKNFGESRYVYLIRDDYPLSERIDIALMRLAQSGLSEFWKEQFLQELVHKQKWEIAKAEVPVRPLNLTMLTFAFNILGVGLFCATISFICEMIIGRKRSKK